MTTEAQHSGEKPPVDYRPTVDALDAAYPNGWRCGHDTTDGMTVVLAHGLRLMAGALFGGRRG